MLRVITIRRSYRIFSSSSSFKCAYHTTQAVVKRRGRPPLAAKSVAQTKKDSNSSILDELTAIDFIRTALNQSKYSQVVESLIQLNTSHDKMNNNLTKLNHTVLNELAKRSMNHEMIQLFNTIDQHQYLPIDTVICMFHSLFANNNTTEYIDFAVTLFKSSVVQESLLHNSKISKLFSIYFHGLHKAGNRSTDIVESYEFLTSKNILSHLIDEISYEHIITSYSSQNEYEKMDETLRLATDTYPEHQFGNVWRMRQPKQQQQQQQRQHRQASSPTQATINEQFYSILRQNNDEITAQFFNTQINSEATHANLITLISSSPSVPDFMNLLRFIQSEHFATKFIDSALLSSIQNYISNYNISPSLILETISNEQSHIITVKFLISIVDMIPDINSNESDLNTLQRIEKLILLNDDRLRDTKLYPQLLFNIYMKYINSDIHNENNWKQLQKCTVRRRIEQRKQFTLLALILDHFPENDAAVLKLLLNCCSFNAHYVSKMIGRNRNTLAVNYLQSHLDEWRDEVILKDLLQKLIVIGDQSNIEVILDMKQQLYTIFKHEKLRATLVEAYCITNRIYEAVTIFATVPPKNEIKILDIYHMMIEMLLRNNDYSGAQLLFKQMITMETYEPTNNNNTRSLLVNSIPKHKIASELKHLLEQGTNDSTTTADHSQMVPIVDTPLDEAEIEKFYLTADYSNLSKHFEVSNKNLSTISLQTLQMVVHACVVTNSLGEASHLLRVMFERAHPQLETAIEVNDNTTSTIEEMQQKIQTGTNIESLLNEIWSRSWNVAVWSTVNYLLSMNKNVPVSYHLLKMMALAAQPSNLEHLLRIYDQLPKNYIEESHVSDAYIALNILIRICLNRKEYKKAQQVAQHMTSLYIAIDHVNVLRLVRIGGAQAVNQIFKVTQYLS
jgi:hypothetical protein